MTSPLGTHVNSGVKAKRRDVPQQHCKMARRSLPLPPATAHCVGRQQRQQRTGLPAFPQTQIACTHVRAHEQASSHAVKIDLRTKNNNMDGRSWPTARRDCTPVCGRWPQLHWKACVRQQDHACELLLLPRACVLAHIPAGRLAPACGGAKKAGHAQACRGHARGRGWDAWPATDLQAGGIISMSCCACAQRI